MTSDRLINIFASGIRALIKVFESGKFELEWMEDGGEIYRLSKSVKVS